MNLRTLVLARAFRRYNAGVDAARADYHAHPTAACRFRDCDDLGDPDYCPHHRKQRDRDAAYMRARRAKEKTA